MPRKFEREIQTSPSVISLQFSDSTSESLRDLKNRPSWWNQRSDCELPGGLPWLFARWLSSEFVRFANSLYEGGKGCIRYLSNTALKTLPSTWTLKELDVGDLKRRQSRSRQRRRRRSSEMSREPLPDRKSYRRSENERKRTTSTSSTTCTSHFDAHRSRHGHRSRTTTSHSGCNHRHRSSSSWMYEDNWIDNLLKDVKSNFKSPVKIKVYRVTQGDKSKRKYRCNDSPTDSRISISIEELVSPTYPSGSSEVISSSAEPTKSDDDPTERTICKTALKTKRENKSAKLRSLLGTPEPSGSGKSNLDLERILTQEAIEESSRVRLSPSDLLKERAKTKVPENCRGLEGYQPFGQDDRFGPCKGQEEEQSLENMQHDNRMLSLVPCSNVSSMAESVSHEVSTPSDDCQMIVDPPSACSMFIKSSNANVEDCVTSEDAFEDIDVNRNDEQVITIIGPGRAEENRPHSISGSVDSSVDKTPPTDFVAVDNRDRRSLTSVPTDSVIIEEFACESGSFDKVPLKNIEVGSEQTHIQAFPSGESDASNIGINLAESLGPVQYPPPASSPLPAAGVIDYQSVQSVSSKIPPNLMSLSDMQQLGHANSSPLQHEMLGHDFSPIPSVSMSMLQPSSAEVIPGGSGREMEISPEALVAPKKLSTSDKNMADEVIYQTENGLSVNLSQEPQLNASSSSPPRIMSGESAEMDHQGQPHHLIKFGESERILFVQSPLEQFKNSALASDEHERFRAMEKSSRSLSLSPIKEERAPSHSSSGSPSIVEMRRFSKVGPVGLLKKSSHAIVVPEPDVLKPHRHTLPVDQCPCKKVCECCTCTADDQDKQSKSLSLGRSLSSDDVQTAVPKLKPSPGPMDFTTPPWPRNSLDVLRSPFFAHWDYYDLDHDHPVAKFIRRPENGEFDNMDTILVKDVRMGEIFIPYLKLKTKEKVSPKVLCNFYKTQKMIFSQKKNPMKPATGVVISPARDEDDPDERSSDSLEEVEEQKKAKKKCQCREKNIWEGFKKEDEINMVDMHPYTAEEVCTCTRKDCCGGCTGVEPYDAARCIPTPATPCESCDCFVDDIDFERKPQCSNETGMDSGYDCDDVVLDKEAVVDEYISTLQDLCANLQRMIAQMRLVVADTTLC